MIYRSLVGAFGCLAVALACANASPPRHPGAHFIDVHAALARLALSHTPASEEAAAGWRSRPHVTFLRAREQQLNPINLLPGVKPLLDGLQQFSQ